jgi:septum formation protein
MLEAAGVDVTLAPARLDEAAVRAALAIEGATPRDVADTLAEMKARKIAERQPDALVLGADQVIAIGAEILGKAGTPDEARAQLMQLRGRTHMLISAAVLYDRGEPVWRHAGTARLTMRTFSEGFLDAYLARNWPAVAASVGGYQIEAEGVRLFERIEGDHFTILGLPLLPLLSYLGLRGFIAS